MKDDGVRKKALQIAIDGPVASGKSTVAKRIADRLNMLYIDTGAMYRATAYLARKEGVDWNDEEELAEMLRGVEIKLKKPVGEKDDGRKVTVTVDGKDVSWEIRTQEMGEGASVVSQYPGVRSELVSQQQKLAQGRRVVMEGRDIGTRVLKNAPLKIFMTADVESRVRWKQNQLRTAGEELSLDKVREGLMKRDEREMNRRTDPLRPAKGAWILDTTDLDIEGVVVAIEQRVVDLGL